MRPPVKVLAGKSRLLMNWPIDELQNWALHWAFCSGVLQKKLQMFLGAAAGAATGTAAAPSGAATGATGTTGTAGTWPEAAAASPSMPAKPQPNRRVVRMNASPGSFTL